MFPTLSGLFSKPGSTQTECETNTVKLANLPDDPDVFTQAHTFASRIGTVTKMKMVPSSSGHCTMYITYASPSAIQTVKMVGTQILEQYFPGVVVSVCSESTTDESSQKEHTDDEVEEWCKDAHNVECDDTDIDETAEEAMVQSLESLDKESATLNMINSEFGLKKVVSMEQRVEALLENLSCYSESTPAVAFCGVTGVGKTSLLNYLLDEESLILEKEDTKTDEEKKQLKKKGFVIRNKPDFAIGYQITACTLFPNITHIGEGILAFDLAGFMDNRGFAEELVVDALLARILQKFKFQCIFVLCDASTLTSRGSNIEDLHEALQRIGLGDILQLVITKANPKAPRNGFASYEKFHKKSFELFDVVTTACDEPDLSEHVKEAYRFFSKLLPGALFMNYEHYASETRTQLFEAATRGSPKTPDKTFALSPLTEEKMANFFELLSSLLLEHPLLIKFREVDDEIFDTLSQFDIVVRGVPALDALGQQLLSSMQENTQVINSLTAYLASVDQDIKTYSIEQDEILRVLLSCQAELAKLIKAGQQTVELYKEKKKFAKIWTCKLPWGVATAVASSDRKDKFSSTEFTITSYTGESFISELEVKNCNLIYDSIITVIGKGKRSHTHEFQNKQNTLINEIASQKQTHTRLEKVLAEKIRERSEVEESLLTVEKTGVMTNERKEAYHQQLRDVVAKLAELNLKLEKLARGRNVLLTELNKQDWMSDLRTLRKSSFFESLITATVSESYQTFCSSIDSMEKVLALDFLKMQTTILQTLSSSPREAFEKYLEIYDTLVFSRG